MKRPFTNPAAELAALCATEIVLDEQLTELSAIGSSVVGTVNILEKQRNLLDECRTTIKKFKVIHKLNT